jgi:ABC-type hemin transport system substrate-binding protein
MKVQYISCLLNSTWDEHLMHVVSLLPSAIEIVYALGYGDSLVCVSHEWDFPEGAETKPKMIESIFDTSRLGSEQWLST